MEQEKLYVIEEKTYEAHIDEEVHLYGLLHQLAFLAGKIKDREDVEAFIAAAKRYGQIADDKFDAWNIPGRYLVFGDKADLAGMKARELCELDAFYVECENDEPEPGGGRQEEHYLIPGSGFRLLVSELHMFLVTWYSIAKCLSQAQNEKDFPTPLASDKSTGRDAANLDVFLSDNGIFRKRNKDGTIWSLSLSAAVFYLTPAASEGYRSTLKPAAFRDKSPTSNLSAQVIRQEKPLSEKAALNPDWVEWLMGFPPKWTDASYGVPSPKESPA